MDLEKDPEFMRGTIQREMERQMPARRQTVISSQEKQQMEMLDSRGIIKEKDN